MATALAAGVAWRDLPTGESGDGKNIVDSTPDQERFTPMEGNLKA